MPRISIEQFNALTAQALPLAAQFGFRVDKIEPGRVLARAPFSHSLTRPGGTIAGPVIMGLADYAMYAVVMSRIGPVAGALTTNLNINFMRKPEPVDLIGEGRLLKLGRSLAVGDFTIWSDGLKDPVAHATVTYSIPPQRSKA